MDVEHKQTALDDNADIYKSRDNSFGKKDIRALSGKQRLEYFRDYYLIKVLIALAVLVCAGALLDTMVFHPSRCVLAVTLVGEKGFPETEEMNKAMTEYLSVSSKNDYVVVENYDLEDYQMNMAYVTKAAAGSIDVVICTKKYFEEEAARGMFADLREVLPEALYDQLQGQIVEGQEMDEVDDDGKIVSWHDPCPYGIDISGSAKLSEFGDAGGDAVLGIARGAQNTENALKALEFFGGTK